MGVEVTAAVTTWNNEHTAATSELETLEAALKASYNAYIDSLAAYISRVKQANDMRQDYIRVFSIEDRENGTTKRKYFLQDAKDPVANAGTKYMLDPGETDQVMRSYYLVRASDSAGLSARKR